MSKVLKGSVLAGGKGKRERVKNDYYATPPTATRQFLERLQNDGLELKGSILEPATGGGHMSDVLKEFYGEGSVTSTDLVDRGYSKLDDVKDFLEDEFEKYDNVITNPPFKYAQEFIEKGLEIANEKVIMFAKIQLLEGKKRHLLFKNNPPSYIYVHSSRVNPYRNGSPVDENGKKWSSTMCFAWFVWDKRYSGETILRWLE